MIMDNLTTINISYNDSPLEVQIECCIHSILEDLWTKGIMPENTQHVNVGYSIWSFIHSRSEIAKQELQKKFQEDSNSLISDSSSILINTSDSEEDKRVLEKNLHDIFTEKNFLLMTKDALKYMQDYYEYFLFLPAVAVVSGCLEEYKNWRKNQLKPHTLDYTFEISANRIYTKDNLYCLFYDFCEGNILTNVFFVMKRHNENPIIFDNFYDGVLEYRASDSLFRDCFDRSYGFFRKRHRGSDTDWDFATEDEQLVDDKLKSNPIYGNGLAQFTMLSEAAWLRLYNFMAPAPVSSKNDSSTFAYFFPRTPETKECWISAYHGNELKSVNKIGWQGSAYSLHMFIDLLSKDEQPAEACWQIVSSYFCKSKNPKMWSASTLQKSTMHKGKDNDEPYVKRLKDIINRCKD